MIGTVLKEVRAEYGWGQKWDETEARLVERGQLKAKETNKKKSRLKAAGLMISQLLSYHRR